MIEWPDGDKEPTKYWLSNLSEEASLRELVYWAKIRWWVEQNYQQLKDNLGLDHFEGRSYNGWHHHVPLTMIAFGFLVMEGFRVKKNYWVDPPSCKEGVAEDAAEPPWLLSNVRLWTDGARETPPVTWRYPLQMWFTLIPFWNVAWMAWRRSPAITKRFWEKYGLTAMSSLIRKCRFAVTQPFSRLTLFRTLEKRKCAGIALRFFTVKEAVGSSSRPTGQSLSI